MAGKRRKIMRSDCKNRQGASCDQRRVALYSTIKDTPKASRKKKSGQVVREKIKSADGKNDREGRQILCQFSYSKKEGKGDAETPSEVRGWLEVH